MRTFRLARLLPLVLVSLAVVPLAQAHPGHGQTGLAAGFLHPLTGWDHLLAMVAVGLWAAQLGGRARWLLPCSFVGVMMVGAAIGIAGFAPPRADMWILASVFVLGALIASAARLPLGAGVVIVGLAGFFHGAAHGAEMPLQADSIRFLAGMVAATALLHTAGVVTGVLAARRSPAIVRWAGWGVLAGGAALLVLA